MKLRFPEYVSVHFTMDGTRYVRDNDGLCAAQDHHVVEMLRAGFLAAERVPAKHFARFDGHDPSRAHEMGFVNADKKILLRADIQFAQYGLVAERGVEQAGPPGEQSAPPLPDSADTDLAADGSADGSNQEAGAGPQLIRSLTE